MAYHGCSPCGQPTYVESNVNTIWSDITGSGAAVLTQMLLARPFILDVLGMNTM